MKRMKFYIITIGLALGLLGAVTLPVSIAAASPQSTVCGTLGANSDCSGTPSNGINIDNLIKAIINILSIVVGVVAVFMIIVAGIRFVTSAGDSNGISSARSTIIYALVGLFVVAMAQAIVKFVLTKATH